MCALVASCAVVAGSNRLVSAAPSVDVAACAGTTSSPTGTVNTPASPIVLTDTAVPGVGQVADLNAGRTVFLYDNKGRLVVQPDGTYVSAVGGIPLCGVHLDPASGQPISSWSFCTDESLYGCADQPPSQVAVNPKLTSDDEAIIADLQFRGDTSTKRSRAILQIQVWCISEGVAAGAVNTYSGSYFAGQFTVPGGNLESAPLTAAEETCFDQAYRDAAIAAIPATAVFTLTGPTATTISPGTATFTLTTNFSGEVALTITGADSFGLCPGDTSGATLAGSTLTLPGASTVQLCALRSSAGTVTIDGAAQRLTRSSVSWVNYSAGCQYFSTFSRALSDVDNASAAADFTSAATTTTTAATTTTTAATTTTTANTTTTSPTTTSTSTTTTSQSGAATTTEAPSLTPTTLGGVRGLPVTGSDSAMQLRFTALLLVVGFVLVQLTRRRSTTVRR